jgi:prophage regulatory protein
MSSSEYMDLKELQALLNISRQTIERKIAAGEFPKKIYITDRRVRWLRREVELWKQSKANARFNSPTFPNQRASNSWIPISMQMEENK